MIGHHDVLDNQRPRIVKAVVNEKEVAIMKGESAWLAQHLNEKGLNKLSEDAQHINIIDITENY